MTLSRLPLPGLCLRVTYWEVIAKARPTVRFAKTCTVTSLRPPHTGPRSKAHLPRSYPQGTPAMVFSADGLQRWLCQDSPCMDLILIPTHWGVVAKARPAQTSPRPVHRGDTPKACSTLPTHSTATDCWLFTQPPIDPLKASFLSPNMPAIIIPFGSYIL